MLSPHICVLVSLVSLYSHCSSVKIVGRVCLRSVGTCGDLRIRLTSDNKPPSVLCRTLLKMFQQAVSPSFSSYTMNIITSAQSECCSYCFTTVKWTTQSEVGHASPNTSPARQIVVSTDQSMHLPWVSPYPSINSYLYSCWGGEPQKEELLVEAVDYGLWFRSKNQGTWTERSYLSSFNEDSWAPHQQQHVVCVRMFVCVYVYGLKTKKSNKNVLQNMLRILFSSWINKQF